jgi:hypothetical protein
VEADKDLEAAVAVAADRRIGVKDAATRGRDNEGISNETFRASSLHKK